MGLPALQLADVGKIKTHCRKEICWTCLLKKSIPAIPFRNSKHPLPGRSNFLTAAARSTLFALGLQKIPSLRCSCWKNQSYAEKQRVWSWSCGLQDLLQCSDCALSCATVCDCCMRTVEIELLAAVGWKWGCQPCSCRVWQNETHCRIEI